MMQDLNLRFDEKVAVATTAASTYYVDLLAASDAMPAGVLVKFRAVITTTFGTATNGVALNVQLQTASDSSFTLNTATLAQSGVIALAKLNAQTANSNVPPTYACVICSAVLPEGCQRYLRAYYVCGGDFNAGNVTTELVLTSDKLISPTLAVLTK